MADNLIITIARQFGSDGRAVGRKVSEMLGIAFYDRELIALAAKESGLSENLFKEIDEKPTYSLLYSLVMGMQSGRGAYYRYGDVLDTDGIFRIQSRVIREIAAKEPCVIVGRCSDYILRDEEKIVNVFIHAPEEKRIERIIEMHNVKEREAENMMHKTDKRRSGFYNFYTNQIWGKVENYDISLDTSKIGADRAAEIIVEYAKIINEK